MIVSLEVNEYKMKCLSRSGLTGIGAKTIFDLMFKNDFFFSRVHSRN